MAKAFSLPGPALRFSGMAMKYKKVKKRKWGGGGTARLDQTIERLSVHVKCHIAVDFRSGKPGSRGGGVGRGRHSSLE